MPIYEYFCAECKTKFDARRPMDKADAAIQCKQCESIRTSRVLSLFAVGGSSSDTGSMPANFRSRGGGCCGGGACGCGQ